MKKILPVALFSLLLLAACKGSDAPAAESDQQSSVAEATMTGAISDDALKINNKEAMEIINASAEPFAAGVAYKETPIAIDPGVAADFDLKEVTNMKEMEAAYGAFSAAEKAFLAKNKFVMKDLTATNILPVQTSSYRDSYREFWALYNGIKGGDVKQRKPENSLYYSSDVFLHAYSVLFTELLKEMENRAFVPAMKEMSETFFKAAQQKTTAAETESDKELWRKVRNYFAIPHTILSTMVIPNPSPYGGPPMLEPDQKERDASIDTETSATTFVKGLKLDAISEGEVLADIHHIFDASDRGVPTIFDKEFEAYAQATDVQFKVDWSQFTPRSHYTSSSMRRQYFRAMSWYIHVPFFLKSPTLTAEAFAIAQLFAEQPAQLRNYAKLERMITFLVGTSDDLMPADYLLALQAGKNRQDPEAAIMEYLVKARPPKIKSLGANYPTVGDVGTADVVLLTKGMRLFSGKFIIDSYWTGMLTQGDEAVKPGYTQKLPPMASSLEVMSLLGSEYAASRIPTLDFYKPETSQAIDQAMKELSDEMKTFDRSFWTANIYHIALWSIQGLFGFQTAHHEALPAFMRSAEWAVKTLQTASGFWTEMRHATLLYAKQSFAELGGGAPCDPRPIPPPAKSYIEPQPLLYDRLHYLAARTKAGIEAQGFTDLLNINALESYVTLLEKVRDFTGKELMNAEFREKIVKHSDPDPDQPSGTCVWYEIEGGSEWENLRLELFWQLERALPFPVEGPVLPAKDRRAALIADVHTGGDSLNKPRILYEATGVPKVIFVAVKDANGPRLTVGFTYAHYEFTELYGGKRKTDEDWQKIFYNPVSPADDEAGGGNPYDYTDRKGWPAQPVWYDSILKPQ